VDRLRELMQSSEDFLGAVGDHDYAQCQAHGEKRKRLHAVEISHGLPPSDRE
jgi:hypothetical protein